MAAKLIQSCFTSEEWRILQQCESFLSVLEGVANDEDVERVQRMARHLIELNQFARLESRTSRPPLPTD